MATVSAESEEFGKKIAHAIDKVGKDGVVTVEESQSFGVESEFVEGMQFDKGYVSPYMITNADRMEAVYEEPYILLVDKKISAINEILPLLEKIAATGKKELVIIADDLDGEALTTLVVNKLRGTFNTLAIKSPGYGDRKKEMLQDIATVTGAKVISEEVGLKLDKAEINMLGKARKVIATKDNTTIVGGKGKRADIDSRIAMIRKEMVKATRLLTKKNCRKGWLNWLEEWQSSKSARHRNGNEVRENENRRCRGGDQSRRGRGNRGGRRNGTCLKPTPLSPKNSPTGK